MIASASRPLLAALALPALILAACQDGAPAAGGRLQSQTPSMFDGNRGAPLQPGAAGVASPSAGPAGPPGGAAAMLDGNRGAPLMPGAAGVASPSAGSSVRPAARSEGTDPTSSSTTR